MINKIILNGTQEIWLGRNTSPYVYALAINDYKRTEENICLSNYFISTINGTYGSMTDGQIKFRYYTDNAKNLYICTTKFSTVETFKTWLSTHNTIVYYVSSTPTTTEITNNTLIEQLNTLEQALSYNNQTNISQTNNNLPFIINATALMENSD